MLLLERARALASTVALSWDSAQAYAAVQKAKAKAKAKEQQGQEQETETDDAASPLLYAEDGRAKALSLLVTLVRRLSAIDADFTAQAQLMARRYGYHVAKEHESPAFATMQCPIQACELHESYRWKCALVEHGHGG